jgi:hypothetical protein
MTLYDEVDRIQSESELKNSRKHKPQPQPLA